LDKFLKIIGDNATALLLDLIPEQMSFSISKQPITSNLFGFLLLLCTINLPVLDFLLELCKFLFNIGIRSISFFKWSLAKVAIEKDDT